MNILNLPGWDILALKENERDYLVEAEFTTQPTTCPHCGKSLLDRHGKKTKQLMDTPIHGKRVGVLAFRQRYKCQSCGKTFLQELPDVDESHSMTKRLVKYIEREVFRRTFVALSDDVGVDEKTIRNIFREYVARLEKERVTFAPEWLGVDELKLAGGYRGVFSNVKDRSILELLSNRKKTIVSKFLMGLPGRGEVQLVCMDMWQPYREMVQAIMPQAQVVVDKFHFVRMASQAMETVRKDVREGLTDRQRRQLMHDRFILLRRRKDLEAKDIIILESWLGYFDLLKVAYLLKEELYNIWDLVDRQEAEEQYEAWEAKIDRKIRPAFQPLLTAMGGWHDEIFAYFDHRATNAYTESLNGLMKLANRMGRGYSFEVIRARILFGNGARVEKYSFFNSKGMFANHVGSTQIPHFRELPTFYRGTPISTIIQHVQDERFLPVSTQYSD